MPRNKTRGTSIWNLYTINKYFKGLCEARMEGTDRIYETPIYEAVRTNDGKRLELEDHLNFEQ